MIFKVNIDKLFRELEEKVIEEQRNIGEKSLEEEEELEKNYTIEEIQEEVVKNNDQEEKMEYEKEDKSLESPEDAKETQEVHEPTSKDTEESHGGDEASKEIKNSPNAAKDGENSDREKKVEEGKKSDNKENAETSKYDGSNNGQEGQGKGTGDKNKEGMGEKDINDSGTPEKGNKDGKQKNNTGGIGENNDISDEEKNNNRKDEYYITGSGKNPSKVKPITSPEELEEQIKEMFERKRIQEELAKKENKDEYLKKYMIEIIKKIAAKHAGIDKQDGSETYDKKRILEHILKKQSYKIMGDKYDLKDARYIQFFIDTSGVYGNSSNRLLQDFMPEVVSLLAKQGYDCHLAACGNGFYSRDMVEDKVYNTRKTLEKYNAGEVSKIACPTPLTAAKMANDAEFSIILADFDGLSSICEMASLCNSDKVPYLFCTEDKYSWDDPTAHDWVDPNMCDYNPELVYDVSINGNPTLEKYHNGEYSSNYYDERDDEDDYYDRDYDD